MIRRQRCAAVLINLPRDGGAVNDLQRFGLARGPQRPIDISQRRNGQRVQHQNFFQRFLDRKLRGVESEIVYPTYRVGNVLLSHGHYLDAHLQNSLGNRLLARSAWRVAGGAPMAGEVALDLEAIGPARTRAVWSGWVALTGLLRLIEPLMAGEIANGEAAELRRLKENLEATPVREAATA